MAMIFLKSKALRSFLTTVALAIITAYGAMVLYSAGKSFFPDFDYLPMMKHLRDTNNIGDALALADFVAEQADMPNREAILEIGQEIRREQERALTKVKNFAKGFFAGEIKDTPSTLGAVISDFIVVGDIRDLGIQGYRWIKGEDVDEVIVALSSVGTASSVASLSGVGTGAGVPVEAGTVVLKALRKAGALSRKFCDDIVRLAGALKNAKNAGEAKRMLGSVASIAKNAPPGTLPTAFRVVDTAADLKPIERGLNLAPNETVVALRVHSKEALPLLNAVSSKKELGTILRKGNHFKKIGFAARVTKFFVKDRVTEIVVASPFFRKVVASVTILCGTLLVYRLWGLVAARKSKG